MKQYGAFFATEFSKKQVNVIYAKAKCGDLKVEKWFINELYTLSDYYGYDSNRSVASQELDVKSIIKAVFENDIINAQDIINTTEDKWYSLMSRKNQEKCCRDIIVA